MNKKNNYYNKKIVAKVKQIIHGVLGINPNEIILTDHLIDNLNADSLAMFEIRAALEKEFNIIIPDSDVTYLSTSKSIIQYLTEKRD